MAETKTGHSICILLISQYLNLNLGSNAIWGSNVTLCKTAFSSLTCLHGVATEILAEVKGMIVWHSWDGSLKKLDSGVRCILCLSFPPFPTVGIPLGL